MFLCYNIANMPQELMEPRMTSSSPPTRRGRSAKSGSKKSFSEDSEEEEVEMVSLEEDFPETLLFDPVSPPRKLSLKSKVTLKRIVMAKVDGIPAQVVAQKTQLISTLQSDNTIGCLLQAMFSLINTFLE